MSGDMSKTKYNNGKLEIESQGETDADAIALENQANHEVHHVSRVPIQWNFYCVYLKSQNNKEL